MAQNTSKSLRNLVIYSIYIRNYGKNGKFEDVEKDLQRIKSLGTDIIWFLPIHPIGKLNKKGDLGCPYAIKDYREVNPEYGTLEDFKRLISKIHQQGMKVMIDVVYHHTSPDSYLVKNHPEYFYKKADGTMGNKVGDWSDIVDLDFNNKDLWNELIGTLEYWSKLGVDGFRCDVAPLVPIEFWCEARRAISKINPETIWLSESVEPSFILYLRSLGFTALSDSEIFNAFDVAYDYDVHNYFKEYLKGQCSLKKYIEKVSQQEYIYPDNYVKLRYLENHDQPRAKSIISDLYKLRNWTAYMFFQKGMALIYNGQETQNEKVPSLFDIDKINWDNEDKDFIELFRKMSKLKKEEIMAIGNYCIEAHETKDVIIIKYEKQHKKLIGIFNVGQDKGEIELAIEDGKYINYITGETLAINKGNMDLIKDPVIIKII